MEASKLRKLIFRVRPEDVVAALLLYMPERFIADEESIHRTFAKLAAEEPALFDWFEVTSDFPYPFSRRLERALRNLGQSQLLAILNPSFAYYSVDSQAKETIRKRIWDDRFTKRQKKVLKAAASKLEAATRIPASYTAEAS